MRILITGSRHLVATEVVRQLHSEGHTVYTADSARFDFAKFSRHVRKSFLVPSVRFDEHGYIQAIIKISIDYDIQQILPLGEEVFYLADNYRSLHDACPELYIHSGTAKQLKSLHNKQLFANLAQSLNITAPDTQLVTSPQQVIDYQQRHHKHIILKKIYSRFGASCVVFNDIDYEKLKQLNWKTPYILQQFIDGQPEASYSHNDNANVIFYSSKLHTERPSAMVNAERMPAPPIVSTIDKAIRDKLNYTGQLGLDFIDKDGVLYLIEANPRSTLGYALQHHNRIQSRLLMFHGLLSGMFPARKLLRFTKIFLTYPDTLFRWNDPLPALASQFGGLIEFMKFRHNHSGSGTREYSSYDAEYNGPSYKYHVEFAVPEDNKRVLHLLEQFTIGRAAKILYTRRPDAIASLQSEGEEADIGIIKDGYGDIAYMMAIATNQYYLNGVTTSVGYVSDLRKDKLFPYKIDWFKLFFDEYTKSRPYSALFFSIMTENRHAISVITRSRHEYPKPKLIAQYTLFIINPRHVRKYQSTPGIAFVIAASLTKQQITTLVTFLHDEGKKHDLFPYITNLSDNNLGITLQNSYVLMQNGEIVGFVSITNKAAKKQYIVKQYAWYIKMLLPLNKLAPLLGLMSLPTPDTAIDCPALSLAVVKDDDLDLFRALIRHAAQIIEKCHSMCMITLPNDSVHAQLFRTPFHIKVSNNLYVIGTDSHLSSIDAIHTETTVLF